jgi:hypothetical protein
MGRRGVTRCLGWMMATPWWLGGCGGGEIGGRDAATLDAAVVEAPDASGDLAAPDTGDDAAAAAQDATTDAYSADAEDSASHVASPCPPCAEDAVCRPDRGLCVGAGVVSCEPPCAFGTTCGLAEPAACYLETCAPRSEFPAPVLKLTSLAVATDSGCGGAGPTAFGRLAGRLSLVGMQLAQAVAEDRATILLEPRGFEGASDGLAEGTLTWLFGTLDPTSLRCDPTADAAFCGYTASRDSWDVATPGRGSCEPWMVQRARLVADPQRPLGVTLTGGGRAAAASAPEGDPRDLLQFAVPTAGGGHVLLQLHAPTLEARASRDPSHPAATAGELVALSGRLCGVVPMASLRAALAGLPAALLEGLGGLGLVEDLLAANLTPDVDLDGDGVFDGASAALDFTATRARLTGLSPR